MKGRKIVIIEDENDLAAALQEELVRVGFVVRTASSGEEGVQDIKRERPDLILLDSMLPQMSGLQVLEELKTMREEKNIPVIMFSNSDNPDDIKKAREYNIEEYLVKTDWRLADVVQKIKDVL